MFTWVIADCVPLKELYDHQTTNISRAEAFWIPHNLHSHAQPIHSLFNFLFPTSVPGVNDLHLQQNRLDRFEVTWAWHSFQQQQKPNPHSTSCRQPPAALQSLRAAYFSQSCWKSWVFNASFHFWVSPGLRFINLSPVWSDGESLSQPVAAFSPSPHWICNWIPDSNSGYRGVLMWCVLWAEAHWSV